MKAIVCDICGKIIANEDNRVNIDLFDYMLNTRLLFDCCRDCYSDVDTFIEKLRKGTTKSGQ